ncbi:MAG: hypothetical protein ABJC26_04960 [Gemmatimonadaceae bacterium]
MRPVRIIAALAISAVGGFYLMTPLGLLFDWLHWPIFNSSALLYSTGVYAWPILTVIVLAIVVRCYHWSRLRKRKNTYD